MDIKLNGGSPSRLTKVVLDDKRMISYRPRLNSETGSVTGTILLCQIMYWAEHSGNPFWKFMQPCEHHQYRQGDSWCEELGFTRTEMETAFKRIGQKISKATAQDPDAFVWYWTDMARLTWYRVNWERVERALLNVYGIVMQESCNTQCRNPEIRNAGIQQQVMQESGFTYKEQRVPETTQRVASSSGPASPPLQDDDDALLNDLLDLGVSRELADKVLQENPRCVVERKIKDSLVALRSGKVSNLQGWAMKVFGGVLYSSVQVAEIVRKRESEEVKEKSRLKPAERPAEASGTEIGGTATAGTDAEEPLPDYTAEDAQAFAWSLKGAAAGIWQARGLDSRIIRAMFREWLQGEGVTGNGVAEDAINTEIRK